MSHDERPRAGAFRHDGHAYAYLSYPAGVFVRPEALTDAEAAVAELVAGGVSSPEIARRRGVSQRTVANQLASIFRKLGVTSRGTLVLALKG